MKREKPLTANDPRIPLGETKPKASRPKVPKGARALQDQIEQIGRDGRVAVGKTKKEYAAKLGQATVKPVRKKLKRERGQTLAESKRATLYKQAQAYSQNAGTALANDLSNIALRRIVVRAYLPQYTRGEERLSAISHIAGAGLALVMLIVGIVVAALAPAMATNRTLAVLGMTIFGLSAILLYTISAIYHFLYVNPAKKVLRVLDHCSIYVLIAGSYTPICLMPDALFGAFGVPINWGWVLLGLEWGIGIILIVFNSLWLKSSFVLGLSIAGYIVLGWGILPFSVQIIDYLTTPGFTLLLLGGILYTAGAILFGAGSKIKYMHGVAHILYVVATILHFLAILLYGIIRIQL